MESKRSAMIGMVGLLAGGLLAAAPAAAEDTELVRVGGPTKNLIGRDLNGVHWNGHLLDGRQVTAVYLDSAELDGDSLSLVELRRSRLWGRRVNGGRVPPRRMVGATFEALLDDGNLLRLMIEQVERAGGEGGRRLLHYRVSYESLQGWRPLCGTDADGAERWAIPLDGRWNLSQGVTGGGDHVAEPGTFTFACENFVLAKCVRAGYRPWVRVWYWLPGEGFQVSTLADHHQACTRLLRADYCGDGTSHTDDGIWVNMYDALGVRIDVDDWPFEAEWTPDGAACVASGRLPETPLPACAAALASDACGDPDHFEQDSLLFSEVAPESP